MMALVIDDNDDYRSLIGEFLLLNGHKLIAASDGREAREALQEQSVDLIISDVFMPNLDGVMFHSYVRDVLARHDVPFIFISGHDDPYVLQGIEDPELDYFVSKKAPLTEFMHTMNSAFETQTQNRNRQIGFA